MRAQLSQGGGLNDAALKNRMALATEELKKAAQTIQDQNRQIAALSERIEALQSLQMEGPITLTGTEASSLQPTQEEKIQRLKEKLNTPNTPAAVTPAKGTAAAPMATPTITQKSTTSGLAAPVELEQTLLAASSLRKEGDWQQAQALLNQALQSHGEDARIFYNLGNIHADQQEWTQARTAYEKALKLDASFAQAHYNAGIVAHQAGDKSAARLHLTHYLKQEPHTPQKSQIQAILDTL
jgi:tetratricopeptide (TPR) repeat protein